MRISVTYSDYKRKMNVNNFNNQFKNSQRIDQVNQYKSSSNQQVYLIKKLKAIKYLPTGKHIFILIFILLKQPHMNSIHDFSFNTNNQNQSISANQITVFEQSQHSMPTENLTTLQIKKSFTVVETQFEEKNSQLKLKKHSIMFEQSDSDVQDSLQNSRLNCFLHEQSEEEESQEQIDDYVSYNNGSTMPPYLMMTRVQRQNYFERLNSTYLNKMNQGKPSQNLNSNSDKSNQQIKRKPAIKFNDIVNEVVFGKEDQPMTVRYTLHEQTYIRFDDAAYQQEDDQESDNESVEQKVYEFHTTSNNYFDELNVFDFNENTPNPICSDTQKPQQSEFDDTQRQENQRFQQNHETSFVDSPKIRETIHLVEPAFDQEQESNAFKRDANLQFLLETSASDSNSSDSSSSEWKETDYNNEEFESYFELFLQGRKINPNSVNNETQSSQ